MELAEVEENPAVWREAIPVNDVIPVYREEDIGGQDVWAKVDEGEQKAKKMPDPLLKKEIFERILKQQPSSPISDHADSSEKYAAMLQAAMVDSLSISADASEVLDFYMVETMPEVLHYVDPVYPEIAKNAGLNNRVFLKFMVNVDGSVNNVSVLRGLNIFRQPAIDALSQWRFEPAKHKGKAVPVWMMQSITFREPQPTPPVFGNADTSGVLKKNDVEERPHPIPVVKPEYPPRRWKRKKQSAN